MIRTIPLKIQNEYITGDKGMIGAAGSHNDVILRMEFSGMWDGLTKMVQFRDALGEATIEVLLTADMLEADDTSVYLVPVPSGAKKYAGEMTVCIKGAAVSAQKETRATLAVYGRFTVAESKWSADAETEADVPASNVEKLQGQIDNVLATIVDARKAATEAAKSAEGAAWSQSRAQTSEKYAGEYAQNAADSAIAAGNSAASASDSAASASSSATAAASSATAAKTSEDAAVGSAANAAASATSAGKSAAAASEKATYAANSASVASSKAGDAIAAASDAQTAKSKAAESQSAAKRSEDNAAANAASSGESATAAANSASSAAESIKHAPRINTDGKWELWSATKNAYVATEYTAVGKDGTRGRGWYQHSVKASNPQVVAWTGWPAAPKWGEGDWLYNPDNGNVGLCTSRTNKADGSGSANITYKGTLRGTDGTTPHIGANGNWYIGETDTGVKAAGTSSVFSVIVTTGSDPDSLSANKTLAEIKSAYASGSMVVVRQSTVLYYLTYMSDVKAEFTYTDETYCYVLSCANYGAPSEADIWQLNRTKRLNYDTKYRDIGLKTVPVAIKELQDKSAPAVTDADTGKYLHVNASTKELEWAEAGNGTPLTKDSIVTALGYTPLNPSVDNVTLKVNGTKGLSLTSAYSIGLDITADTARMNMTPVARGAVANPSPAVKFKGDASSVADWGADKNVILTGIADGTEDNDAATVRQLKGYVASESPGWTGGDMLMMRDGEGFITYAEKEPGTVGAMPNVPVNDAAKGKYLHVNASTKELEWAEAGEGTTPHIGENGNWYIGSTDTGKPSRGATGAPGADGKDGAAGTPGKDGTNGTNGITPTIGANGNWYLGTTDTGKPSRGATGAKGDPGTDYVLTSADKSEIAALVLAEIPNGDEVAYG